MPRNVFDLSHFSFQCGDIGRLQTLSCIPVVAGDSLSIDLQGVFRLSPLRRNLTVDCIIDLFAFYVPFRHIYGQNWIDFIKQGTDEAITFSTVTISSPNAIGYFGAPKQSGTVPLWLTASYNRIWNRYFRVPSDTTSILADTALISGQNGKDFGELCARPKVIWSTGIESTLDTSDHEIDVSGSVMDILDLARLKARYRSEQTRDWFATRYNDLLKNVFGSGVNTDADERPTLIMRKTQYMSGYDVDGTDDASLGSYSGKAASVASMRVPRRFCPEHGTIWVMALLRFPTIHEDEIGYLHQVSQPTYLEIAGDPQLMSMEEPAEYDVNQFFTSSSSQDLGHMPYGQWWRYQPSLVHNKYDSLNGFAFINNIPSSINEARYIKNAEYVNSFQTEQLGQWQSSCRIDVKKQTVVPGALKSVFAGAD